MRFTYKVTYPNNVGVTGHVFGSGQIYIQNNLKKEVKYRSDIDNQTEIKDVRNFMIGPVFGHFKDALASEFPDEVGDDNKSPRSADKEENGKLKYKEIDRLLPIGILQLINKKGSGPIGEYDRKKFEAIQNLIGMSIDNTSEQHSIINIRLGLFERLKYLNGLIDTSQNNNEKDCIQTSDIESIDRLMKDVKYRVSQTEKIKKE